MPCRMCKSISFLDFILSLKKKYTYERVNTSVVTSLDRTDSVYDSHGT
jgi:hypothetical protein